MTNIRLIRWGSAALTFQKRERDLVLRGIVVGFTISLSSGSSDAAATDARDAARITLERAGAYFRDRLGVRGTYVWRYSIDGKVRRGEGGPVGDTEGWVQPPGTPAVGAAFLRIREITADARWLEAAREVAGALVRTQLRSGGWYAAIETDPAKAKGWCYRAARDGDGCAAKGNPRRDTTVLDDNNTQSALNFLMWFDQASAGSDPRIGESIRFGLHRLMEVQHRNGAFPPFFSTKSVGHEAQAPARATIPQDWPKTWQKPQTPPYYVVNDNLPRDTGRLFLNAYAAYRDPAYLEAAVRVGDFLISTQLPAPHPGWAQTYNSALEPVWGRKFEPPSVASQETAGSIEFLVELSQQTGRSQYLDAAAAAAEWLNGARLPEGVWARFYELRTNRPLYVSRGNHITFDDADLIDGYRLKGLFGVDVALAKLSLAQSGHSAPRRAPWVDPSEALDPSMVRSRAQALIQSLDAEGRWLDGGWLDSARFVDGVFTLARALSAPVDLKP